VLVDEEPHELGDADDRVGVVELDDRPVGELIEHVAACGDRLGTGPAPQLAESRKHAASRPRPPLPRPGSRSAAARVSRSSPRSASARRAVSSKPVWRRAFSSCRPSRYSADR
jgi:sirohydrochlorin ferrochelatase